VGRRFLGETLSERLRPAREVCRRIVAARGAPARPAGSFSLRLACRVSCTLPRKRFENPGKHPNGLAGKRLQTMRAGGRLINSVVPRLIRGGLADRSSCWRGHRDRSPGNRGARFVSHRTGKTTSRLSPTRRRNQQSSNGNHQNGTESLAHHRLIQAPHIFAVQLPWKVRDPQNAIAQQKIIEERYFPLAVV